MNYCTVDLQELSEMKMYLLSLHQKMNSLSDNLIMLKGEIFKKKYKVYKILQVKCSFHTFQGSGSKYGFEPTEPGSFQKPFLNYPMTSRPEPGSVESKAGTGNKGVHYVYTFIIQLCPKRSTYSPCSYLYLAGCWFGNPNSRSNECKVWVDGVSEYDLRAVDCQLKAQNLCRKLIELLFAEEELKNGNATETRTSGVSLLDSHKLYAIRG